MPLSPPPAVTLDEVAFTLGEDDSLESALIGLAKGSLWAMTRRLGRGREIKFDFQAVVDVTAQPDVERRDYVVEALKFSAGALSTSVPVKAVYQGEQVIEGRRLLVFEGEIGS